jgi:hypothetical protein
MFLVYRLNHFYFGNVATLGRTVDLLATGTVSALLEVFNRGSQSRWISRILWPILRRIRSARICQESAFYSDCSDSVVDSAIDSAPSLFLYICHITVVTRFGQRTDLTFKMPRMAERVKAIIATTFPHVP